eukprot:6933057-Prymnesium_polylepis.1
MTDDAQCDACTDNCRTCSVAGPASCDPGGCHKAHTLSDGQCLKCAAHCNKCDEAGPGGCN